MFRILLPWCICNTFIIYSNLLYSQEEITPLPLDKLDRDSLNKIILQKEIKQDKAALAALYSGIYSYYLYSDNRDSGFKYIIKAEENAFQSGDSMRYYYIQLNLGEFYASLDFERAKIHYGKALNYYTRIKNYALQSASLGGFSFIYELKKDTINQLKYLDTAEKVAIIARDTFNIVGANYSHGNIMRNKNQLDSAIFLFTRNLFLIDHAKTFGNSESIRNFWKGWHLNKLAECYYLKKNYTLSIKYLEEALPYNNLTETFDTQNAFRSRFLINNFIQTNQKDSAIKYVEVYYAQTTKTLGNLNPDKLREISAKYETEKKQREIVELEQRNHVQQLTVSNQRRLNIIFLAISAFVLICTFFIVKNIRQKRKIALELARQEMHFKEQLHKQKESEIRNRISRDLHDDVGATLSSVKAYSELLRENPDNPVVTELIQQNATEMIEKLEVIAWAANPQHDSFSSLFDKMKKFAYPLFHAKNIEIDFSTDGIDTSMSIPGEVRQNLLLIFKEAINNTAKYSGADNCKVEVKLKNYNFILRITDNGIGMNDTIHNSCNGIKNMKARAGELGGELKIITEKNKGVTVEATLPYPFKNTRYMG